jgi:hypothetical protein
MCNLWHNLQLLDVGQNLVEVEVADERFKDVKGVIRSCKSKKNRRHNGHKNKDKRKNNDL